MRYISASEACWRIFGFSLHAETPSVTRLAVHLPDEQMVTFRNDAPLHEVAKTPCARPQRWPHSLACCFLRHSRASAGWGQDSSFAPEAACEEC